MSGAARHSARADRATWSESRFARSSPSTVVARRKRATKTLAVLITMRAPVDAVAPVNAAVATRDAAAHAQANATAPPRGRSHGSRHLLSGDYGWSYHEISTAGATSVFAIDMDGDGDIDALSAADSYDTVAWYENLDGSGGSWSYHEIATGANDGAYSVFGIDLDGDGDVDVLLASRLDDTVGWYENLGDGSGGSWSYHEIYAAADAVYDVFGIDVDGDGDIDALSASNYDDTVAWYENLDGIGGSWSYHAIYTGADRANSVVGIDVDGDGDIDVLSASAYDDTIAWYENLNGNGASWSYHQISTTLDYPRSVFAIDLDGDGDVDVLSASANDDTIVWYENLDGSGGSWSYHAIYTGADGAMSVFAIDMDGDGDVDAVYASPNDDTIAWSENLDGSGGSWSYHEIFTAADGARWVFGIDLDGDGDIDVLSASSTDDTIAWCVAVCSRVLVCASEYGAGVDLIRIMPQVRQPGADAGADRRADPGADGRTDPDAINCGIPCADCGTEPDANAVAHLISLGAT